MVLDDILFFEELSEDLEHATLDMASVGRTRSLNDRVTSYTVSARDMQLMLTGAKFMAKHVAGYLAGTEERPSEDTHTEAWCMRGCLREHEELAYAGALLRDSDMAEAITSMARDDLDATLTDLGTLRREMAEAGCAHRLMEMVAGAEMSLGIIAGEMDRAVGELSGERYEGAGGTTADGHEPTQ